MCSISTLFCIVYCRIVYCASGTAAQALGIGIGMWFSALPLRRWVCYLLRESRLLRDYAPSPPYTLSVDDLLTCEYLRDLVQSVSVRGGGAGRLFRYGFRLNMRNRIAYFATGLHRV